MKAKLRRGWMVFVSGLVLVAFGLGCRTAFDSVAPLPSMVVRVKGSARYARPGETNWIALKKGALLETGAVVQTAGDSLVDIALGERRGASFREQPVLRNERTYVGQPQRLRDVIRLDSDSVLRIDKLTSKGFSMWKRLGQDAQLSLRSGRIFGAVGKLADNSKLEVKLTNCVVRAQSAVFSVTTYGLIAVKDGAVTLIDTENNLTNQVKAGFEYDRRTGETQEIPSDCKCF